MRGMGTVVDTRSYTLFGASGNEEGGKHAPSCSKLQGSSRSGGIDDEL
eukprot:gene5143-3693_t